MSGLWPAELIARKRDGGELDEAELRALITGLLAGEVSEGQMAAFLMAGVIRGFSDAEARFLTRILWDSGETLDLSRLPGPTIDKHSTGGVGDGTTLLVAPLLAAAGAQLVKLSGRGLGHTGGTLDKLEAIPGMQVELDPAELLTIAADVGCVVAAQSDRLVPADKALYALRDVTATVESPALIASSVMAKKLAAGASTIVLDVKTGHGAFMSTADAAEHLARLCVGIGTDAGRRCTAIVSDMEQPLGRGIGNALEVAEAVDLLAGKPEGRLAEVALELAALALADARALQAAAHSDLGVVRRELITRWERGEALDRLRRMVEAQGGDPRVCEAPGEVLPRAPETREVVAMTGGVVSGLPARTVGKIAARLGAGRARKDANVDPAVGVRLAVEVGDSLEPGQLIATVHARRASDAEDAVQALQHAIVLAGDAARRPVLLRRITPG